MSEFDEQLSRVRGVLVDAGYLYLHTYPSGPDFVESWMSRDSAVVLYRNRHTVKLFREIGEATWQHDQPHAYNADQFTNLIASLGLEQP